jgi:hypothetical protein
MKLSLRIILSIFIVPQYFCNKTYYIYYPDGKIQSEKKYDRHGVIASKQYSTDGVLVLEEHYKSTKEKRSIEVHKPELNIYDILRGEHSEKTLPSLTRHGVCSHYYCQDGSIKFRCIFKNGKPFNGIWPPTGKPDYEPFFYDSVFFKYTNGRKDTIIYILKKFPFQVVYYYAVDSIAENCYLLNKEGHFGTYSCDHHGDGDFNINSYRITGYDSNYIQLINLTDFKINKNASTYLIIEENDIIGQPVRDSLLLTWDSSGVRLRSERTERW